MRQIIQHMRTGLTELLESPLPSVQSGTMLIQTTRSLISAGTEPGGGRRFNADHELQRLKVWRHKGGLGRNPSDVLKRFFQRYAYLC